MLRIPKIYIFFRYESQNTDFAINYFIKKGANKKKIVLAIPFYGQTFTLASSRDNGLNAPATGPGEAGPITRQKGMLSYYEICEKGKYATNKSLIFT